jgi:xanthine dehydrogenase molybdopterin-binding subunit B
LKADPLKVRQVNLYKKGDITPSGQPLPYFIVDELIDNLMVSSDYIQRLNEVKVFNKNNRWKKKGISLTPIK